MMYYSTGAEDSPTVQWSALQTMFEQAASDVVLLLDCCAAASSTGEAGGSLTELIAACGFENAAPGVGEHSFTRSLIEELRGWNHHHFTMSVAKLHSEVLARIKHWKPRYSSNGYCERRNTPVYILLANEGKPRSIELTPLTRCETSKSDVLSSGPPYTPPDSDEDVEMAEFPDGYMSPSSHLSDNLTAACSQDRYPKVIISVALEEDQVLHTRDWCEWLKSVPAIVKFARVQGIYKSDSTLVIMTIPVVIWDLIPSDPAISFLGFVKSENLLSSSELPGSKVTCLQPSHHSVFNQRESNFSVYVRINDRVCKASIHHESPSSNISSACIELCGLDRLTDPETSDLYLSQEPTENLPRTSRVMIDVGTVTLSHKFVVVDSTDATVSLGADFFEAHNAYTDAMRQSLMIYGEAVKLLVESEEVGNAEMSLKISQDKSMLLPKAEVAQEIATGVASSALESIDTTETQLSSRKEETRTTRQQRINGTLARQTIYRSLHGYNMIRLVVLEPASDYHATIHCSLKVVSLDDEPLYEALSYDWGDRSCTSPIMLDGIAFQVTLGLQRALRHLRHSRREALVLWIDAICIDQQNIEERGSQVLLMSSIYQRARGVLVWLGEETATTSTAIGFLRRLNNEFTLLEPGDSSSSLDYKQRLCSICESEPSSSWRSLRELFHHPWWKRLWNVQEAALARKLTMQYGYLQFDFALVARPAALLLLLLKDYEQWESAAQYKFSGNIKGTIRIWLRAVRMLIFLKVRLSSSFGLGLMEALRHYCSYEITVPRDDIFALEGLAQQQTTLKPMSPNYWPGANLELLQAAQNIMHVQRNLNFFSWESYEPAQTIYDLPSWAPGWIRALSLTRSRWPRVVKTIASSNEESAFKVVRHDTMPAKWISFKRKILRAIGIQADTLEEIGEIYPFPMVTLEQFSEKSRAAQRKMYKAQSGLQETAWWEALLNHSCEQHGNTTWSTRGIGTGSITPLSRSREILLTNWYTCPYPDFNRLTYISITSRGYLCFVPPRSQVGDVVCVLLKAKVPFIFRRTDDGTHFRLIGEWSVLSMELSYSH